MNINFSFSSTIDESIFEKILQDNDNLKWKIVKKTRNQTIYNMEIKDSKIPVVKVVVIDSVSINGMVQSIINIKEHTRFSLENRFRLPQILKIFRCGRGAPGGDAHVPPPPPYAARMPSTLAGTSVP